MGSLALMVLQPLGRGEEGRRQERVTVMVGRRVGGDWGGSGDRPFYRDKYGDQMIGDILNLVYPFSM